MYPRNIRQNETGQPHVMNIRQNRNTDLQEINLENSEKYILNTSLDRSLQNWLYEITNKK